MQDILETVMLVCFGLSWPINLVKNYRARTAKSTSIIFMILIIVGYVAGICAKVISGNVNYVLAAYIVNLTIVFANLGVYFRNRNLDRIAESGRK